MQAHVLFLKPVQTGFPTDCDSRLLVTALWQCIRPYDRRHVLHNNFLRSCSHRCVVCWQQAAVLGIEPTYGPHAARLAHTDARGRTLQSGYSPDSDTEADEAR